MQAVTCTAYDKHVVNRPGFKFQLCHLSTVTSLRFLSKSDADIGSTDFSVHCEKSQAPTALSQGLSQHEHSVKVSCHLLSVMHIVTLLDKHSMVTLSHTPKATQP